MFSRHRTFYRTFDLMKVKYELSKDQSAVGDAEQGHGQQHVLALQHLVSLPAPSANMHVTSIMCCFSSKNWVMIKISAEISCSQSSRLYLDGLFLFVWKSVWVWWLLWRRQEEDWSPNWRVRLYKCGGVHVFGTINLTPSVSEGQGSQWRTVCAPLTH